MGSVISHRSRKIGDRLPALRQASIIVDNREPARLDFGIQRREGVPDGFIEIAVDLQQRQALNGSTRDRVPELPFQELHLTVKQARSAEINLALSYHQQPAKFTGRQVQILVGFQGRPWQSFKRIREPHDPLGHLMTRAESAHEKRRAASSDAAFNAVAFHAIP
jgi:hypothetical protein